MKSHDASQTGRGPDWVGARETERTVVGLRWAGGQVRPRISVERSGCFAVVRVVGELDIVGAPDLRRVLQSLQGPGCDVAVDLSAVEFVDSSGLHVFVEAHHRAADRRGRFVVVGAAASARRTMRITGLDEVLNFASDLSALDAIG